jgi:hypothetical protein
MASKDIGIVSCRLFFCPIKTRVPMKFGPEVTTSVVCARTEIVVAGETGKKDQFTFGEKRHVVVKGYEENIEARKKDI